MNGLILLVSYPKSGNTWLRLVLESICLNGEMPDINGLGMPNAAARAFYDSILDCETSDLSAQEIARARPWVWDRRKEMDITDTLLKVHDANLPPPGGQHPPFTADIIDRVVYVARDPRDVVMSCAHHFGVSLEQSTAGLCNEAFMMGHSLDSPNSNVDQLVSSWSRHAESWLDAPDLNLHLVRYEDLLSRPLEAFSAVATFVGLPSNADLVARAIKVCSFASLSEQERVRGFRETHFNATTPFFRRGVAGEWRDALPTDLAGKIVRDHGSMMRRLGYIA